MNSSLFLTGSGKRFSRRLKVYLLVPQFEHIRYHRVAIGAIKRKITSRKHLATIEISHITFHSERIFQPTLTNTRKPLISADGNQQGGRSIQKNFLHLRAIKTEHTYITNNEVIGAAKKMASPSFFDDLDVFMRSLDQQGKWKNPSLQTYFVQAFRQPR